MPTTSSSTSTSTAKALSAARGLSGVQYLFAALALVGFLAVAGFAGYGQYQQTQVWDDTAVCADGATDDCLVPVEGRVSSRLVSGEKTYYFYPDAAEERSRVKLGDQRKWSSTFERALYDGDDLVGLESYDGDREYKGGLFVSAGWYLYGMAAGAVLLVLGVALLLRSLLGGRRS